MEAAEDVAVRADTTTEADMTVQGDVKTADMKPITDMATASGEFDIYSSLYDLAYERLKENGKEMIASKETFRYMTLTDLGTCEGDYLKRADDTDFLAMAYLGFLKRLPDPKGEGAWNERRAKSPDTYRSDVIRTFRVIKNTVDCNTHLEHNCVPLSRMVEDTYLFGLATQKRYRKIGIRRRIYEMIHNNRFIAHFYDNAPDWMRRFIRSAARTVLGGRRS